MFCMLMILIDDDETPCLMAEAALKSSLEAQSQLQEKQSILLDETKIDSKLSSGQTREKLLVSFKAGLDLVTI